MTATPPPDLPRLGFWRQLGGCLHKDLLIGWRGRARLVGLGAYAVVLLLLFAFAIGADPAALREHAPAYVWLAVLSASTLLLVQSFQQEVEGGAMEGLLLLPTDAMALYYGKAVANLVILMVLTLSAFPVAAILYDVPFHGSVLLLLAIVLLGCGGLAAPGTLYAALTARTQAQQLLLPVLMFPLVVPPMLAVVRATSLCVTGDPMGQLPTWAGLLVVFDLLYWTLGGYLFARLVEE